MRVYRALYWVVMAGAFLYALYSGNRFSWLLFLVQALVLAAALGINLWTVCSFSYVQELSAPRGEKGQSVELRLGIYNDKPFPFTRMRVTVDAPDPAQSRRLDIDLAPKARCSFELSLSLPRRGEFMVGMSRLDLQDVFGLLPMHFDLRRLPYYRQKPLLVLPRVREVPQPVGRRSAASASGLSGGAQGQEELSHLRGWLPGDRLSRVHWAASAKTRILLSHQYQDPAGDSCLIFLDCSSLDDSQADVLCECAAALLYAHLSRGEPVDLRGGGSAAPERAFSLAGLDRLREWLALLRFDQLSPGGEALAEALASGSYSRAYVLGGRLEPELLQAGLEAVSWRYWVTEPLPPGSGTPGRTASIGQTDVAEFLLGQMGEEL